MGLLPSQRKAVHDDGDDNDDDDIGASPAKRTGRKRIKIEYIEDKNRRHITFSKRKAGIMKKAYELSTLTGTQILLLIVSETGLVYTFTTPKLQPMVTKPEGKSLIQTCLNAPDTEQPQVHASSSTGSPRPTNSMAATMKTQPPTPSSSSSSSYDTAKSSTDGMAAYLASSPGMIGSSNHYDPYLHPSDSVIYNQQPYGIHHQTQPPYPPPMHQPGSTADGYWLPPASVGLDARHHQSDVKPPLVDHLARMGG